jgi:hypothetical protein
VAVAAAATVAVAAAATVAVAAAVAGDICVARDCSDLNVIAGVLLDLGEFVLSGSSNSPRSRTGTT